MEWSLGIKLFRMGGTALAHWFSFSTLMLGIVRRLFIAFEINDAVFCGLYNLFSRVVSSTSLGFGGEEC